MKDINILPKLCVFFTLAASIPFSMLSCDDEEPKMPVIESFSPASGLPGTSVTIAGANFSSTPERNEVMFNGVNATVTTATSSQLIVTVPTDATPGKITVGIDGRVATSATDFEVSQTITGFLPSSGGVGATVTINGLNFDATPANNVVKFNGVTATVSAASATQLTVAVPSGATTGKITVTINAITATFATDFTVLDASVGQFSPTSGVVGTTVAIDGANFSAVVSENVVKFNNVEATVNTASTTQLTATVPATATTGKITVTVNGKTATSVNDFTISAPTITSFFPGIAASGRSVVITGTNFSSLAANNIVKFNGVEASVTAATGSTLTVTVPAGVSAGTITVKVGTLAATSATNFEVCVGSAELVISDVVVSGTLSTQYSVSFKVTNSGSTNADLSKIIMQNYASVDAAVGNDVAASGFSFSNAGVLAPGQSYTTPNYTCSISGGTRTSHPYLIITIFDAPDGSVPECNTANNIFIRQFNQ